MREDDQNRPPTLIAGRDFSERPDGRLIFSREYLLARGTCCGSKCRNCPYENRVAPPREPTSKTPLILSFVPSWTETLLGMGTDLGVDVVARTRFCIHPKDLVKTIRPLGGTKNFSPQLEDEIRALRELSPERPVVAILDREENPRSFYDELLGLGVAPVVTHVETLEGLPQEISRLSQALAVDEMLELKVRYERVLEQRAKVRPERALRRMILKASNGVGVSAILTTRKLAYVIWKKPWMCVSHQTLIAQVLEFVLNRPVGSAEEFLFAPKGTRYPEFESLPEGVLPLYSSEPYPFLREIHELPKGLFVDGELYSWFGIRLLRFLEDVLEASK